MKVMLLLFTLSILHFKIAICQERTFSLLGTINIDTGEVKLTLVGDSSLYPKSVRHLVAPVKNGKFIFEHKIPHPLAYNVQTTNGYASGIIVIEPGIQKIVCNVDSSRKVPDVDNKVMQEYARYIEITKEFRNKRSLFEKEEKELREKYPNAVPDTLKSEMDLRAQSLYNESDKILLSYIKKNPESYWALWQLIYLTNFGYEKIFDEMMPLFVDSIKHSYSGKELVKILKKSGILSVGNKFPQMGLLQVNGSLSPEISFTKNRYTLIDFWYTQCSPCLAGFPSLVTIYDAYHKKGFEIAGIATDALKYKQDLPFVIKKHNLKWPQYWDLNGKGSTDLSILAFPTNFLLDANGIIIQKNISSAELAAFLDKNL